MGNKIIAGMVLPCVCGCANHEGDMHDSKIHGLNLKPSFEMFFNDTIEGRTENGGVSGKVHDGASFVESVEGKGIMLPKSGSAASIELPSELWGAQGTLALRFRTSRTLQGIGSAGKPAKAVLLRCPVFTLELCEKPDSIRLDVRLNHDGTAKEEQAIARFASGKVDWSRLDAGKWYHLAVSWDSRFPENSLCCYLNGSQQEEMRYGRGWWHPWRLPKNLNEILELGGTAGDGDLGTEISIGSIQLFPEFMYEEDIAITLAGRPSFPLTGEGRWSGISGNSMDLSAFNLSLIYSSDFDEPLKIVDEARLFEGGTRRKPPEGTDWVFESGGKSCIRTENGQCNIETNGEPSVLWNTRTFPENFLLEFGVKVKDSCNGLCIVFFAANACRKDSGIFDGALPARAGVFKNYTHGEISAYHVSYWSAHQGMLRRSANLRKDPGFHLAAVGVDKIGGAGSGPHTVRILKTGNLIQLETNGKLSLEYVDEGKSSGTILKDGCIGLRQMAHSRSVAYTHFKVWDISAKH